MFLVINYSRRAVRLLQVTDLVLGLLPLFDIFQGGAVLLLLGLLLGRAAVLAGRLGALLAALLLGGPLLVGPFR